MSCRDEHDTCGVIAGLAAACVNALADGRAPTVGELCGGGLAGLVGSRIPDWLEPPSSPRHRGPWHSVTFSGVGSAVVVPKAVALQRAAFARAETRASDDPAEAFLLNVLGGAATGLVAGHLSHLVLDGGTPAGLPLTGLIK